MAIYVYEIATGVLVSWCPNDTDPVADPATLAANGLASVSGLPALGPTVAWNPSTKTTQTVAAPTPALNVTAAQFVMLFTPAETAAIRASTDPNVQHWLFALSVSPLVNLNDTTVIQPGLQYLVAQNLITSARMAQIVANQSPS
jgi:hypothetical protein